MMPKAFLVRAVELFSRKLNRSLSFLFLKVGVSVLFFSGHSYLTWIILYKAAFLIFSCCFWIFSTRSSTFLFRLGRRLSWDSLLFIQGYIFLAILGMSKYFMKRLVTGVLWGCLCLGEDLVCYLIIWWNRCMYMASEWGLSQCDSSKCLDTSKRGAEVSTNLD